MTVPRLQLGQSDPVSYKCICDAGPDGGLVLLFYRYYANTPRLPLSQSGLIDPERVQQVADWHQALTVKLCLTGKIRVASEGFNVTVAGSTLAVESYMEECYNHWSFSGLPLASQADRNAYFKPSPGCACVFAPATASSIRVCAEITPLGITDYAPTAWTSVTELEPAEFHSRCKAGDVELMDLRNHYESRIGFFVKGPSLEPAIRPAIRRFSQWPRWASNRFDADNTDSKQLLTYCTGGIRCEKATRWLAEKQPAQRNISTLKGGIARYLDWVDDQVAAGAMSPADSLFKGRNYVFDARGALGLRQQEVDESKEAVACCQTCSRPTSRLSKCPTRVCHLVLVVCADCGTSKCCNDCGNSDNSSGQQQRQHMCSCERARELLLWGHDSLEGPGPAQGKAKGWLKTLSVKQRQEQHQQKRVTAS